MDLCYAPNCDKQKFGSNHCKFHIHQLLPIYQRYKKLQDELPTIKIEELKDIKILLNYYNLYSRIYNLRQQYRRKGFKEQHQDWGHQNIIDNLWSTMQTIIKKLEELTINIKENENIINEIEEFDDDPLNIGNIDTPKKAIKTHHKLENEELWNRGIPCLINKNVIDNTKIKTIIYNQFISIVENLAKKELKKDFKLIWVNALLKLYQCHLYLIRANINKGCKSLHIMISPNLTLEKFRNLFMETYLCCSKLLLKLALKHQYIIHIIFFCLAYSLETKFPATLSIRYEQNKYYIDVFGYMKSSHKHNYCIEDDIDHDHIAEQKECESCLKELRENKEYGVYH